MKMYSSTRYSSGKNFNYYKKPFHKTKGFYILLILVILVIIFILWSINRAEEEQEIIDQKFTDQESMPSLAAKVQMTEGSLELKSGDNDWVEITDNYQIVNGDRIRTAADSKAIIELPDKSLIRVAPNSQVLFSELGLADIVIEQEQGMAFHRVNDQSPTIYRVKNGTIEMTALGTAFNVKVEQDIAYLTVTESRVKVKIYQDEEIQSMRTIEEGIQATVNPSLDIDKIIKSDEISTSDLLSVDWYAWNLEQDQKNNFYTGIFEEATKLVITSPEQSTFTTDEDAVLIKGVTDPEAEIFIDGNELKNNDGNFEMNYKLGSGDNEITIVVKKDKNLNKKILNIKSTAAEKSITLDGKVDGQDAELSWTSEGLNEFKEFKVLLGKTKGVLTYPTSSMHVVGKDNKKDSWPGLEDGEYFFRICAYSEEDGCLAYSNQLNLTIGTEEDSNEALKKEGTINLNTSKSANSISLSWTTSNKMDTTDGFRTIIGQSDNPTYPGSSTHLIKNQTTDTWKSLNPGSYYFRVCLLDGDSCVVYSNSVSETIEAGTQATLILSGANETTSVTLNLIPQNVPSGSSYFYLMNKSANVQYPGLEYRKSAAASYTWTDLTPGETYYFRACVDDGGTCGSYSNEYSVTIK